jgi:tetratricopeptide (TPR) repeat protein
MSVDPDRLKAVLFEAMALLDPAERAAYLDAACGADAELRRRVEAFLPDPADPADSGPPLEALTAPYAAGAADPNPGHTPAWQDATPPPGGETATYGAESFAVAARPPAAVLLGGRYRLLEPLGEGGMGSVWLAEQTEPVKRQVAVKLIRADQAVWATILARFDAERQAIALMDHPHIAKLFDAGTTEQGTPFFVMERVNGRPLTAYCDARRLDVAARLKLFVRLCGAVQHAHQKGIIHRDLKPSNVLVEEHAGEPVPKVIDFGLAKATRGAKLTDRELSTAFGNILGTPLYMAPEQAAPDAVDVDTRADVYALGVILFELLTGTTPIPRGALQGVSVDKLLDRIRDQEPPAPSSRIRSGDPAAAPAAANRRTEPGKLNRVVRGELDWIVLKALARDRDRRYDTPAALARDVERFLTHEPVQAGPPGAGYRLRKFVRRNRGPVLAAGLVAAALVAGIVGTTLGLIEARHQATLAGDAVVAKENALEAETRQREIAERNERTARAETAAKERALAAETRERRRAEDNEAMARRAFVKTADVLDVMTSTATGASLTAQKELTPDQKKFLAEVLTYYKEFAAATGTDEQTRSRTANAAFRVGMIEYRLGRKDEAVAAFRSAQAGYERLAADFPAAPAYRQKRADSLNRLGIMLETLGRRADAREQFKEAIALLERLAAEAPDVPGYRNDLANSHGNLGRLLKELGERPEAEKQLRKAVALQEVLAKEAPDGRSYRQDLAINHNNLGLLLKDLGRRAEARDRHEQAQRIQEKLVADFPAEPEYRADLCLSHVNLGTLLAAVGEQTRAEEQDRKAVAGYGRLAAEYPAAPEYRHGLAKSRNNLASLLDARGLRPQALDQYRESLAALDRLTAEFPRVPEYREDLASSHNNIGRLLETQGRRAEAKDRYETAQGMYRALAAEFPDAPAYQANLATNHQNLARLLSQSGQQAAAREHYRQELAIREKLAAERPEVPAHRRDLAATHANIGTVLAATGKPTEGEEQFRKAVALYEKLTAAAPDRPEYEQDLALCRLNLGNLLARLGRRESGEQEYQKALETLAKLAADSPDVPDYRRELAAAYNNLGALLFDLGRRPEVEAHLRKALVLREKLTADFPDVPLYRQELASSYNNVGAILTDRGDTAKAADQYAAALAIQEKLGAEFPKVPEYRKEHATTHNNLGVLLNGLGRRAEAQEHYRKTLTIYEELIAAFPDVPQYRWDLGRSQLNLGIVVRHAGRPAESLEWFDKAIRTLGPLHQREPRDAGVWQSLRFSYWERARANDEARRFAEAAADWERVIDLTPVDQRTTFRLSRAVARARAGRAAEAVAEAAELVKIPGAGAPQYYDFACIFALAGAGLADQKAAHADTAAEMLRKAVTHGFRDVARLKRDAALDALRDRDDFQALVAELEKRFPPKLDRAPPPREKK